MIKFLQAILALLIISLVLVLLGWLGATIWGVSLFGAVPVLPVVLSLLAGVLAWVVLISVCAFFLNKGRPYDGQGGLASKKTEE